MNTRERFVQTLQGREVDRVPFIKVFGGTNAIHAHWEQEHPGIGTCIDELLQFDGTYRGWAVTGVNMDISGAGGFEILREDENFIVRRRSDGLVEQICKSGNYHHQTLEWPVKKPADWQAFKRRFLDPDDPARFPADWADRIVQYRDRDYPLQLTHRGVYGFARNLMGDENLAYAFYDEPEMVHDMMETYTAMAIKLGEKQAADVQFDLIECWEDMASKNGSLISPDMFRRFMTPCYARLSAFAREHEIPVILVDSDGYIEDLTELMCEAGVTALYPYEVLAGNDVARVLDRNPKVGVIGGLGKESMYEGPPAIDREMEKARKLIKKGRFIPGPDHFVLNLASFANYRYFMESLREVVMTTKPEV